MRGADNYSESLFSTIRLEDFVPAGHPLRPIRIWTNDTPAKMDEKFAAMYEADIRSGRLKSKDLVPKRRFPRITNQAHRYGKNSWRGGGTRVRPPEGLLGYCAQDLGVN